MSLWKKLFGVEKSPTPDAAWSPEVRAIREAVARGRVEEVKALLKSNPDLVSSKDDEACTLLHAAAFAGHSGVTYWLLVNKADVKCQDQRGETALHAAALAGHKDVTKLLLSNKGDVNAKDYDGFTPLHWAARYGHKDVAELLLASKAEVNAKDSNGQTPLHFAANGGYRNLVELLLANKAEVNAKDNDGNTPLYWAVDKSHEDVAELLRQHGRAETASATPEAAPFANPSPRAVAEPGMSTVPTLACAGCGKIYRIGDDAVALALEFAFGLVPKTVVISDGSVPDREDLVDSLDVPRENLPSARERAYENWRIIEDSLSRGQRRTWRCRACEKVNLYSPPMQLPQKHLQNAAKNASNVTPISGGTVTPNEAAKTAKDEATASFSDNGDCTVTDKRTGLMWQKNGDERKRN